MIWVEVPSPFRGTRYRQSSDDLYSIGEMTTDGKDKRTIVEFEHIAEKYNVANGHLYYLTDLSSSL